jgi:mono/diheme cytochrome c family protein
VTQTKELTMFKSRLTIPFLVLSLTLFSTMLVRATAADPSTAAAAVGALQPPAPSARIARGEYLVTFGGCNDCHTPWKLGPKGPEPDMTRMLSGHPEQLTMPPAPAVSMPWGWTGAATMTSFAGPWGVSFTANLTPDKETGLGDWTEEMFIATMKTGRHQGKGRALLPPMPWFNVNKLSDEDIRSVFAYLQSIPAVRNKVPAPIDPAEEGDVR